MSYQDKIYIQNGKPIRNSTAPVVNTSSDVCIFTSPQFTMSGGSKINCGDITLDISGVSFNDILTATTECFFTNQLSGSCFNSIEWDVTIHEDGDLVYESNFHTSTSISGTPTFNQFRDSVTLGFDTLGYDYALSGSVYTIEQVYGVGNISVGINTTLDYQDNCPISGKTNTTFSGTCENVSTLVTNESYDSILITDHNVFPISNQTEIDLEFIFTGNTDSFINNNVDFKFEIFKFNEVLGFFNQPPVYRSGLYDWDNFSGTSAFTQSIQVDDLSIDGDYLIKGYYNYDSCTEFANLLGMKISTDSTKGGDKYQLYNTDKDFYFVSFLEASIPIIEPGEEINREFGSLNVFSSILDGGTDVFSYPNYKGDLIVNLNGLTLSKDFDYTFEDIGVNGKNVLKLSGQTYSGDILTFVYTNTSTSSNNIKQDVIDVSGPIDEGPMGDQGDKSIFYNTTTNKYELYTELTPLDNNSIIVTLNGLSLANNIDYYQSISDPNRIILEGDIFIDDIINIWYNVKPKIQGDIFDVSVRVDWSLNTAPKNTKGKFTLELSSDKEFNNILNSVEVDYITNQIGYSTILGLIGKSGDKLFYRVKNEKKYINVCGTPIISTAFSEVIDITLQTNAINTY